jgi:exodeoxyribonuclease VII small subunit
MSGSAKTKTIENKMSELRELAAWFESDEFSLDDATTKFEAAARLAKDIENDLSKMENTVQVLKESFEQA